MNYRYSCSSRLDEGTSDVARLIFLSRLSFTILWTWSLIEADSAGVKLPAHEIGFNSPEWNTLTSYLCWEVSAWSTILDLRLYSRSSLRSYRPSVPLNTVSFLWSLIVRSSEVKLLFSYTTIDFFIFCWGIKSIYFVNLVLNAGVVLLKLNLSESDVTFELCDTLSIAWTLGFALLTNKVVMLCWFSFDLASLEASIKSLFLLIPFITLIFIELVGFNDSEELTTAFSYVLFWFGCINLGELWLNPPVLLSGDVALSAVIWVLSCDVVSSPVPWVLSRRQLKSKFEVSCIEATSVCDRILSALF